MNQFFRGRIFQTLKVKKSNVGNVGTRKTAKKMQTAKLTISFATYAPSQITFLNPLIVKRAEQKIRKNGKTRLTMDA